mmetsp:Transcript_41763/g.106882  ORF Transcript_41763/g.106882 Transcript_41763/m.106882 type:complete len:203 (-) Transcript_41763:1862-2470(-)
MPGRTVIAGEDKRALPHIGWARSLLRVGRQVLGGEAGEVLRALRSERGPAVVVQRAVVQRVQRRGRPASRRGAVKEAAERGLGVEVVRHAEGGLRAEVGEGVARAKLRRAAAQLALALPAAGAALREGLRVELARRDLHRVRVHAGPGRAAAARLARGRVVRGVCHGVGSGDGVGQGAHVGRMRRQRRRPEGPPLVAAGAAR